MRIGRPFAHFTTTQPVFVPSKIYVGVRYDQINTPIKVGKTERNLKVVEKIVKGPQNDGLSKPYIWG